MAAPALALDHKADTTRLATATAQAARAEWARVDPDQIRTSWQARLPRVLTLVVAAQRAAAGLSEPYLRQLLGLAPDAALDPAALSGIASDGRPLDSLLAQPAVTALTYLATGRAVGDAMAAGVAMLELIVGTQVHDAGRVADLIGIAARPGVAYTRVVDLPACARCIVLAGQTYAYSEGFERHPRCDCAVLPIRSGESPPLSPRELFASMSPAEQLRRFGAGAVEAIREGADIGQVVNARRGLTTAAGRLFTTEGTTRRGYAGGRMAATAGTARAAGERYARAALARPMPEQILAEAESREDAIAALIAYGYLSASAAQPPAPAPAPLRPALPAPPQMSDEDLAAELRTLTAGGGSDSPRGRDLAEEVERRAREAAPEPVLSELSEDALMEMVGQAYAAEDYDRAAAVEAEIDRRAQAEPPAPVDGRLRADDLSWYDDDRLGEMLMDAFARGWTADAGVIETELERRAALADAPLAEAWIDPDETEDERARRELEDAQYERMRVLVEEQGYAWEEAAAEVQGRSLEALRREDYVLQHRVGETDRRSFVELAREQYKLQVTQQWQAAEEATNGFLLTPAAQAAGVDPQSLFSGPRARAEAHASEELKRWWDANGRMNFEDYVAAIEAGRDTREPGRDFNR
ncbi:hypothetical protein [Nocardiopsis sp. CA-288880]|uniref:hypothetical protein n=1 Tax=Nocardiopsis sp. CA-288880 TaxID=3239995 RepID=UPI003D95C7D2